MRKIIVSAAVAAIALASSGGAALAGEVTGQGRGTPILAEEGPEDRVGNVDVVPSACAFSGLEDAAGPGVTQTPKGAGAFTGIACRGPAEGAIRP
ncbi:MAG: hypothetical protein ACLGI8_06615 [Acidimicrobiia bacterium]|jgi:hypothetical protein